MKQSSVKRVQYLIKEDRLNTAESAMKREVHIPVQLYIARNGRPDHRIASHIRHVIVQYIRPLQNYTKLINKKECGQIDFSEKFIRCDDM